MDEKREADRPVGRGDWSLWAFVALSFVAVVYAFVGAWLVTAGPTDPVVHTAAFLRHLVSPWMLATYVVAAAVIGFGAWHLRRLYGRAGRHRDLDFAVRRTGRLLVLVLVLAATSLSGIGALYLRDLAITSRADHATQQQLVVRLKAQQIGKWLIERTVDSELLAASLGRLPLDRLPADRGLAETVELLFAEALSALRERAAVTLFAPDGTVLVHVGEGSAPDHRVVEAARAVASAPAAAARIVDIYDDAASRPRIGFVAPVRGGGGARPLAGVLAVTIDPFRGVLEQIQAWPTPSPSSEVVVVHRQGDDVVFITPPERLSPVPPPNSFRQPLTNSALPAVQAVLHGDAVRAGTDYRGVPVLTASQAVSGLPWIVLAKTDEAELDGPLQQRTETLALVIGAAVVLAAMMMLVLWHSEYRALRAQGERRDTERLAVTTHFAQLTRLARDIILMLDPEGRIVEANQAAIAAYGYTDAELCRLSVRDLRTTEEMPKFEETWRRGIDPAGVLIETVHRRKDGTTFPVEIAGRVIAVDGRPYRQAFIRDISERKKLAAEIARLEQAQVVLQAAMGVLLRARSADSLYRQLCDVLVRLGGYHAVDVAVPVDDAGLSVRLVARAGADDVARTQPAHGAGYGQSDDGPTRDALRTGKVQVSRPPAGRPGPDIAARMALPLAAHGRVLAVLTLQAGRPDAFDKDEAARLAALADDVAWAAAALDEEPKARG